MLRIYYSNEEYEPDKHRIITTYSERTLGDKPEDSIPISNYSVIEVEERYNPNWSRLYSYQEPDSPPKFYVNNSGQIVNNDTGQVVIINPNPQKEAYKLSQLYGLTHEQLDNHIDGISNLSEAKEFMRKQAHVILWLVKQTKLDE